MDDMLHVERILQYSGVLCCTWTSSCNIRGCYVARGARLAIFGGAMLHVGLVLQHSGVLCCTWTSSCNIRRRYVARGTRLATFGYSYCHFSPNVSTTVLLLPLLTKRVNNDTLIVTSCQTCQQ